MRSFKKTRAVSNQSYEADFYIDPVRLLYSKKSKANIIYFRYLKEFQSCQHFKILYKPYNQSAKKAVLCYFFGIFVNYTR